jgi:hypothetical protein
MNFAFMFLWIVIFIALIFLALQGLRNINEINKSKTKYVLNFNELSCYPNNDINTLPTVGNKCCVINGSTTTLRPFTIPGYLLDVLVDTSPIPFQDACYGFCENVEPVSGNCLDTESNTTTPYTNCLLATVPVSQQINDLVINNNIQGCITSALPVARLDQTPYYVSTVYYDTVGVNGIKNNCEITTDC